MQGGILFYKDDSDKNGLVISKQNENPDHWDEVITIIGKRNDEGGYGGYSDWELPSSDEWELMLTKLHEVNPELLSFLNHPTINLIHTWYWTSTEIDNYNARYYVYYKDGGSLTQWLTPYNGNKLIDRNFRAIRAVTYE